MTTQLDEATRLLPLVGREGDLAVLRQACRPGGTPRVVFVSGDRGVGRSRVAAEAGREAEAEGHTVVRARAFPLGRGDTHSLLSDCFTPVLRGLDEATLQVLTRGALGELAALFPAAVPAAGSTSAPALDTSATRPFWAFTELLGNLAERNPLLVVLDDIHWADAPSLELLHFVARHTKDKPVTFVCTYADSERAGNETLATVEASLLDLGVAHRLRLAPLSYADTLALLQKEFRVEEGAVAHFAGVLFGWTRGNSWLIDAVLTDLRERGVLRRDGRAWRGWEVEEIRLPGSVSDATAARFERLSPTARVAAELIGVMGDRARLEDLEAVDEVDGPILLKALDELRDHRIIRELQADGGIVVEFAHPVLRTALVERMGLARKRDLHGRCGEVLEKRLGSLAERNAEILARHYCEASPMTLGAKGRRYLALAGRNALDRQANVEAERYLKAALRQGAAEDGAGALSPAELLLDLGRAQHRLGKADDAIATFHEALGQVPVDRAGTALTAAIRRRIGLIRFSQGRHQQALAQYEAGLQVATSDLATRARADLLLAQGGCLLEVGRLEEAESVTLEARSIANALDDDSLRARVARSQVLLYAWTGPARRAREHGEEALTLADRAGDPRTAFWAHWGLAISAAMAGEAGPVETHIGHARGITDQLGSPALKAWLAELAVELYYATGEWDRGLGLAEQALTVSRSLKQTALTVRLLVLASMIYVERGQLERGRTYVEEAWSLAQASAAGPEAPADFFMMIPAHVGRAACALWEGDYQTAVDVGEAGIALAEGSGYQAWTIHRLLPIVAESHIMLRNLDEAERVGRKLRALSEKLDHTLGLAWASACDAVVLWLRGDPHQGAIQLREATEVLEQIPMVPYAARLRRQLAGRLAETGDRDAALAELRKAHDVFARLGAQGELAKTREMFRQVEARPPRPAVGAGVDGLTGREVEVSRLVADRLSNKAIGRALGISPRTVSTHLSNIFKKVEVTSRGELGDLVRDKGL